MSSATDCEAWMRCQQWDPERPYDPDTFEDTCSSDAKLVKCARVNTNEFYVREEDCAAYTGNSSARCIVGDTGRPICGLSECSKADYESSWCENDKLMFCEESVLNLTDCGALGLSCRHLSAKSGEGLSSTEFCGTGETCPSTLCRGDEAIYCDPTTREEIWMTINCAGVYPGFTCNEGDGNPTCGVVPEQVECEEEDARCDGDIAKVCFGGKLITVDCSTFVDAHCSIVPSDDKDNPPTVQCVK